MTSGVERVVTLQKEMTTDNSQRTTVNSRHANDAPSGLFPHGSLLTPHFSLLTYFSLTLTYFLLTPTYFSPLSTSSQITPSNPLKTQKVKKSNLKASACLFFLLTLHG